MCGAHTGQEQEQGPGAQNRDRSAFALRPMTRAQRATSPSVILRLTLANEDVGCAPNVPLYRYLALFRVRLSCFDLFVTYDFLYSCELSPES